MNKWPHEVPQISWQQIALAVNEADWQAFRQSLKGRPTTEKLIALDEWYNARKGEHKAEIQVANYINALRRGGLLDSKYRVIK